jgi:uncharacterized surface protein with fasciclin (FAS1) repeats
MKLRTVAATVVAAGTIGASLLTPSQVQAAPDQAAPGETSLAEVLTSDGDRFDHFGRDFDVVTEAVLAVIDAKPDSSVALLADGSVALTAFIPNDASFRRLARDVAGPAETRRTEEEVFNTLVAGLGVDAIEQVLLYHVVPGATIDSATAVKSDGASLNTALEGAAIKVHVVAPGFPLIQLADLDPDSADPIVNPRRLDINNGNMQIAHGIFQVLRPIDL